MAATLTRDGELTYVSFPIEKTETDPNGDVIVYGKATDGSLDSDEQIIDPDFAAKAIQDWLSDGANIRVQHNPQRDPAGVGIEADTDGSGATWVKGRIVEPIAQKLVNAGALRAYSVGIARPKIERDVTARGGRITGGQVVEISLVDRPANKHCTIQLVKAAKDGHAELSGEIFGDDEFIRKYADAQKGVGVTATTAEKTVTLELPEDVSVAFTPADLARVIKGRAMEKAREPNVGEDKTPGGVDRAGMPAGDFAGEHRSFPIHSPGDVSDAAQSVGRARGQDKDQIKRNIKRIAHEKGPEYVAELPDSYKAESEPADCEPGVQKTAGACDLCRGSGKIREGNVTCPRCHGSGKAATGGASGDDDAVEKSGQPTAISVQGDGDKDGDGDGLFDADGDGDGAVAERADDDDDDGKSEKAARPVGKKCKTCRGSGKILAGNRKCPDCGGSGFRVKKSVAVAEAQKDWATWDATHRGGAGGTTGTTAQRHSGDTAASASQAWQHAHQALQEEHAGKKPSAAELRNAVEIHQAHVEHEEHMQHEEALRAHGTGGSHVAAKPPAKAPVQSQQVQAAIHHHTVMGKEDAEPAVTKGKTLCKCGGAMKAKHKFCPSCGAPAGGRMGEVPDKTGAKKPVMKGETPADGVKGHHTEGLPPHREPDGAEVEAYEEDAGLQDGDNEAPTRLETPTLKGDAGMLALTRVVRSGAPVPMGVLHDMTCAAFHPGMIAKCYPDRTLASEVDAGAWQVKSLDLAAALPFPQAARAAQLGHHAMTLKSALPADVWEAHEELNKAFSDANPGPGTAPTPASIMPGRFNRPYLAAGHAAPSPQQGAPNSTPITSGEIEAAQFKRPYLAAGHSAESPGDAGPNAPSVSKAVSDALAGVITAGNERAAGLAGKGRTFYSNNGKQATRAAMEAIHNHIAQTFPDLCPMRGETAASAPDAAPESVKMMPAVPRQLTKAEKKTRKAEQRQREYEEWLVKEAAFAQDLLPKASGEPEITKAVSISAELDEQPGTQVVLAELAKLRKTVKKQARQLDELAGQPDPTVTAYRGSVLLPPVLTKQAAVPAAPGLSMADVAERTKAMMMTELEKEFRTSPDPALREAAWRSILQLRGVGSL